MCRHILSLAARLPVLGVALLTEARQMARSGPPASYPAFLTNDQIDRKDIL